MYAVRLILVSILLLAIVVTYSPFAGKGINQSWEDVRPTVLEFMDRMYATLRTIVAGSDPVDGVDDNAPGVDFDRVITMDHAGSL